MKIRDIFPVALMITSMILYMVIPLTCCEKISGWWIPFSIVYSLGQFIGSLFWLLEGPDYVKDYINSIEYVRIYHIIFIILLLPIIPTIIIAWILSWIIKLSYQAVCLPFGVKLKNPMYSSKRW